MISNLTGWVLSLKLIPITASVEAPGANSKISNGETSTPESKFCIKVNISEIDKEKKKNK